MAELMLVRLTQEKPESCWGQSALSFAGQAAYIHCDQGTDAMKIQQAARKLRSMGINQVQLDGKQWDLANQWAFSQGFASAKADFTIDWFGNETLQTELNQRFNCSSFAKKLINDTAENISPQQLAQQAASWLKEIGGSKITSRIITGKTLLEEKWVGTYSVGKGSERPPVMLELDYNPLADDAPVDIALVGKGITFDSGGYSIKSSEGMLTMKADMGGAATVTAALGLAIKQGLNKRVKLYLCCAENLISGRAYKLGDIITYKNGVTVEVVNTDAEGRLVLADGLQAASESGAKLIIDAATLTGAASVAVGKMYNAIFSPQAEVIEQTRQQAANIGERVWPLPLEPWHKNMCPSAYADTANSRAIKGGGAGGASNAAGFLWRFVSDNANWLHMDLAAAFEANGNDLFAAGATGQGILTLAELLKH